MLPSIAEFNLWQNITCKWLYSGLMSINDGTDEILLTESHGISEQLQDHWSEKSSEEAV